MDNEFSHDSELNLELQLVTDVFGLNSLHYGYWEVEPNIMDLNVIKEGQEQYTVSLCDIFPEGVKYVLDIGCGIGDNAKYLAKKGFQVVAISPDQNHSKFFEPDQLNPKFIASTIEELDIEDQFDLILMSESQNYFGMEDGLKQVVRYLKEGGYLVISGNFSKSKNDIYSQIHVEPEYHSMAKQYGFTRIFRSDITNHVLPTVNYAREVINNKIKPAISVLNGFLTRKMPIRMKLAKFFLGGQINAIDEILQYYDDFLDLDNYKRNINYVRLIYQLKSDQSTDF